MSSQTEDQYIGSVPRLVEVAGRTLAVQVHLAWVDGRITCVGLDVRSFHDSSETRVPARLSSELVPHVEPVNDTWVEINSPLMRALRTSEVIAAAQEPLRERMSEGLDNINAFLGQPSEATPELGRFFSSPTRAKRGPRPQLDDDTLREVVAATYRVTAKRPVQAVQAALEKTGALRPPVTIDQARKAVAAARARGFIPPAARSAKQQGGQS